MKIGNVSCELYTGTYVYSVSYTFLKNWNKLVCLNFCSDSFFLNSGFYRTQILK